MNGRNREFIDFRTAVTQGVSATLEMTLESRSPHELELLSLNIEVRWQRDAPPRGNAHGVRTGMAGRAGRGVCVRRDPSL
jgi:hypothetical protein